MNSTKNYTEKFPFGKYKNKTISSVTITDPQYIIWLAESEYRFSISESWRLYIEQYAKENKNKIYAGSYGF